MLRISEPISTRPASTSRSRGACRFKTRPLIPRVLPRVWRVPRGRRRGWSLRLAAAQHARPFLLVGKALVRPQAMARVALYLQRAAVRYAVEPLGVPLLHDGASRHTRGLVPMGGRGRV